jgi:mannosyl-oligosaccharide glucosidase
LALLTKMDGSQENRFLAMKRVARYGRLQKIIMPPILSICVKVPDEFLTQVPNYGNPPTLAMSVTAFIERVKAHAAAQRPSDADLGLDMGMGGQQVPMGVPTTEAPSLGVESRYIQHPELAMEFLKEIYEPLKRHYEWFRRTQRGQIKQYSRKARSRKEAYRWRGRSQQHVLTSGMDDYPRGPPHPGELHIDLLSWMGFFTKTMREIAAFIWEDDEVTYAQLEQDILNNIDGQRHCSNISSKTYYLG